MNANEVIATLAVRAARRAPARCTPTTTSTPRSRRTTCSRRPSTWPSPRRWSTTCSPALEHLDGRSPAQGSDEFADVVKSGRTHLMDATPVTLGQEFGGYAGPGRARPRARSHAALPARRRAAARRHRRRHGHQRPAGLRRPRSSPRLAERTGLPLTEAPDHFAAAGRAGRPGRGVGPAAHRWRSSLIKIANDLRWMGSGPRRGPGRDPPARPPAGVVDHAGQGQPGDPRGGHPGGGPGDRQRRGGRLRRDAGQLRAQRLHADDGPQPARVDPPARPT